MLLPCLRTLCLTCLTCVSSSCFSLSFLLYLSFPLSSLLFSHFLNSPFRVFKPELPRVLPSVRRWTPEAVTHGRTETQETPPQTPFKHKNVHKINHSSRQFSRSRSISRCMHFNVYMDVYVYVALFEDWRCVQISSVSTHLASLQDTRSNPHMLSTLTWGY